MADPNDAYSPYPTDKPQLTPYDKLTGLVQGNFGPMPGMSPFGHWGEMMFPTGDQLRTRLGALTMGFGDELLAGGRSLLGEDYDAALRDERNRGSRIWDRDPKGAITENIYGTLPWFAAPASLAGKAAPWLGRLLGYSGMGAAQGAVSGFGEGQRGLGERAQHAASGALTGAAMMGVPFAGYHALKAFPAAAAGVAGGALGTLIDPAQAQGAEVPKGFFSVLEQALRGSKARAMPAEQWKAFLTPGRREVKVGDLNFPLRDEELKWSGLPGYLEGKEPGERISVDELLKQVQDRPLPTTKTLGGQDRPRGGSYATQYQQHVLPGPTTGYGEELTKFPQPRRILSPEETRELDKLRAIPGVQNPENPNYARYSELNNIENDMIHGRGGFTSSHFGSEGQDLLSHSRWSRRQTDDGKPVHLVEEIQSDWHQQGREQGYKGEDPLKGMDPKARELYEKYKDAQYHEIPPELRARVDDVRRYADTQMNDASGAVPQAPFSKTYHELELKKNLARAVANGDEYLALTTGTQQADRWNQLLHKDLSEIRWDKSGVGQVHLSPVNKGGTVTGSYSTKTPGELRDLLGKEMADKILKDAGGTGSLTGDNLSIGGAGMRHTYDEVYRGYLDKLAKAYGGEATTVRVPGKQGVSRPGALAGDIPRNEVGTADVEVPAIRITDKMRDRVKKHGLPLFSTPAATGVAGLTGYLGLRAPEDDLPNN